MVHVFPEHRPLRLALVTETYPPEINGVAMTYGRLVRALVQRGHELEIVRCRLPGEATVDGVVGEEGARHLAVTSLPVPRYQGLRLGLPCRTRLRNRWSAERPEVVHIATEGPLGRSALHAANDLGIPCSSGFHTNFHDYLKHYGVGMLHRLAVGYLRKFHNATRLTLVPAADQLAGLEQLGFKNLMTLGRGVDTKTFAPERRDLALRSTWGAAPEDTVYIHVGRVAPEKDIPMALAAFEAIQARDPKARMVVVGDGPLRAKLASLHPKVVFTGVLSLPAMAIAYASADVFLFPSRSETFGNVLLEAMASGVPTVAFDYAGARQHLRHEENGLSVPFNDPAAWQEQALRLAGDPELRQRLGAAARITAEQVAWDPIVQRFETLLRRVADHQAVIEPQPSLNLTASVA
jgi:glycosyltransferase involved in cell wall biosynthesis